MFEAYVRLSSQRETEVTPKNVILEPKKAKNIFINTQINRLFQFTTFSNFQKSLIGNVISASITVKEVI